MMHSLTIGQLAENAGVGVETVRFYQRKGLVEEPEKPRDGYRRYPAEAAQRIRFIRQAQEIGFSLREIGELLALRVDRSRSCADVRRHAEVKILEVRSKIDALQQIERALTRLAKSCSGVGPTSECPILDAIDKERSRSLTGREVRS